MAASSTCAFSSSSVRVSLRGGQEEEEEAKCNIPLAPMVVGVGGQEGHSQDGQNDHSYYSG